jgi:hypothetical protein
VAALRAGDLFFGFDDDRAGHKTSKKQFGVRALNLLTRAGTDSSPDPSVRRGLAQGVSLTTRVVGGVYYL